MRDGRGRAGSTAMDGAAAPAAVSARGDAARGDAARAALYIEHATAGPAVDRRFWRRPGFRSRMAGSRAHV